MKKLIFFTLLAIYFYTLSLNYAINKFGIEVGKYKNQISYIPKYFEINDNINKYSWNTPVQLPDSNISIKIEHLTLVNEVDRKLIKEITSYKFLLTMIDFKDNAHKHINSIELTNKIKDKELPILGYYTYERDNKTWKVNKINDLNNLSQYNNIRAVAILYAYPDDIDTHILNITKKSFKEVKQNIKFNYKEQEHSYNFNLIYYHYMSIFDKILLIT